MNRGDLCSYMIKHQIPYLTSKEIKGPLKSIITALKVIHKAGYLHNDLQPCNVLAQRKNMQQGFKVKLGGFSKVLKVEKASTLHEAQVNLYRAPEVIASNDRSTASDVWSLGVTLYVMGTGRFPFNSRHAIRNKPLIWKSDDAVHLGSNFR